MPVEQQLPKDHPLIVAFEAYKQTDEYQNTKLWAKEPKHVDGSLWAAFMNGYNAKKTANLIRSNVKDLEFMVKKDGVWLCVKHERKHCMVNLDILSEREIESGKNYLSRPFTMLRNLVLEQSGEEDGFLKAVKNLVFQAETSGGTAGRDEGLCDAIAEAKKFLS